MNDDIVTVGKYILARNRALMALDEDPEDDPKAVELLTAFFVEYGVPIPQSETALLVTAHKMRVRATTHMPEDAKERSRQWLKYNGHV